MCSNKELINANGVNQFSVVVAKLWIKPQECINSKPYPYEFLDRFRDSDGSDHDDIRSSK